MLRVLLLLILLPGVIYAQPGPDFGGALYLDYAVRAVAPDTHRAGEAGFVLRRAYLAATFSPAARTLARIRFEVDDRSAPTPRLYDAYLRLSDALGAGHHLTLGLHTVREVGLAEDAWGYRVLERTLRDRTGRVDSRDLGASVQGPLSGRYRYALTVGSGGSFRGMERRAGRIYTTLEHTTERSRVAVSGDAGFRDGRRLGAVGVLAALTPGRLRVGVEAYLEAHEGADRQGGAGMFWAVPVRARWTFAGRADAVWADGHAAPYAAAALGYRVSDALDLLPGILVGRPLPGDDFLVTPRVTAHARF